MTKASQVASQSLGGTIVSYLGMGLGFVTTFYVLTKYLSPEEVGLTRLLVEIATLASGFALLGLNTSISRYFPHFESSASRDNNGFLGWTLLVALLGLGLTLPALWLGRSLVEAFGGLSAGNTLLGQYFFALIPLTICITFWTVTELYAVQMVKLTIPKAIREFMLRLLLLACYMLYALGWVDQYGMVVCFILCYTLCTLASFAYLAYLGKLSFRLSLGFISPTLRWDIFRYSALALVISLTQTLAGRMDILVLGLSRGEGLQSVAIFTIGFFIVSIMEAPTRAIIGIATARISSAMYRGDLAEVKRLYEQTARYQLLSALVIYMMIGASLDGLLQLMPSGESYQGAKVVFYILGASKLIEVTFTVCHPIVSASRHYHWSLYHALWLCAVALISNLWFIPLWGTMGAALATALTTLVGYALLQGLVYYRLRVHPLSRRLGGVLCWGISLSFILWAMPSFTSPYLTIFVGSGSVVLLSLIAMHLFDLSPEAKQYILQKSRNI